MSKTIKGMVPSGAGGRTSNLGPNIGDLFLFQNAEWRVCDVAFGENENGERESFAALGERLYPGAGKPFVGLQTNECGFWPVEFRRPQ